MTAPRDGRLWERRAADYLRERGLRILGSRYRCRYGELDLVCADGATVVFVEVRARGRGSVARSAETVDAAKRRKLARAARHLLMRHPQWAERALRFDVVAIDGIDSPRPRYEWIRNAFDVE